MINQWILTGVLSMVVAVISMTTSSAVIFEKVRLKIGSKSQFLNELIRCPYCTSFWVAIPFVLIYKPILINSRFYFIDLAVSWFFIVGASTWLAHKIF
jgi:hypothetical protein